MMPLFYADKYSFSLHFVLLSFIVKLTKSKCVRLCMRLLPTKQCQAGMRLGKGIYNEEGIILLGINVSLTDHLINRLIQLGIDYLYVQDPNTDDIEIKSPLSEQTRFKAITEIRSNFRSLMDQAASKRAVKNPTLGKSFNNILQTIIDELSDHKEALIMLTDINVMSNY